MSSVNIKCRTNTLPFEHWQYSSYICSQKTSTTDNSRITIELDNYTITECEGAIRGFTAYHSIQTILEEIESLPRMGYKALRQKVTTYISDLRNHTHSIERLQSTNKVFGFLQPDFHLENNSLYSYLIQIHDNIPETKLDWLYDTILLGNLGALQWLNRIFCYDLEESSESEFKTDVFEYACKHSKSVDIVSWLYNTGGVILTPTFTEAYIQSPMYHVLRLACISGSISVVKWLYHTLNKVCPIQIDTGVSKTSYIRDLSLIEAASSGWNLKSHQFWTSEREELVQWLCTMMTTKQGEYTNPEDSLNLGYVTAFWLIIRGCFMPSDYYPETTVRWLYSRYKKDIDNSFTHYNSFMYTIHNYYFRHVQNIQSVKVLYELGICTKKDIIPSSLYDVVTSATIAVDGDITWEGSRSFYMAEWLLQVCGPSHFVFPSNWKEKIQTKYPPSKSEKRIQYIEHNITIMRISDDSYI